MLEEIMVGNITGYIYECGGQKRLIVNGIDIRIESIRDAYDFIEMLDSDLEKDDEKEM